MSRYNDFSDGRPFNTYGQLPSTIMNPLQTPKNSEWFVFLGEDGKPYYCCQWGENGNWWLWYWHLDWRKWISLRKIDSLEIVSLPRNLSAEEQAFYFLYVKTCPDCGGVSKHWGDCSHHKPAGQPESERE